MNETRIYTLTFTAEELLEALKRAYPTNLAVQAIPISTARMATVEAFGPGICVKWVKQGIGGAA